MVQIGKCGPWSYTVKVNGEQMIPVGATSTLGCAADPADLSPDGSSSMWMRDIFENPVNIETQANGFVRLSSTDSFINFLWTQ
jgi:hypothetical protein